MGIWKVMRYLLAIIVTQLFDDPVRAWLDNRRRTTSAYPAEWDFWLWPEGGS
jgi:hypothetical protein